MLSCAIFLPGCATFHTVSVLPPSGPFGDKVFYINDALPVAQSAYQCGPASLASVMNYWRRDVSADEITRALYKPGMRGILNFMLAQYAGEHGFWTEIRESDEEELKTWIRKKIPPIIMLYTGVWWFERYHFVVLKGFNDKGGIFYANTGEADTHAIAYEEFRKRSKPAGRWCLLVCPAERVDWTLGADEAARLAFFFEKNGQLDLAEDRYRQALEDGGPNDVVRFNLANIYMKKRRFEEAKTIYSELLQKKASWGEVSNNLAWIYLEQGNPSEAAKVVERAFQKGALRNFDILDTAGLAYCRLKERSRAEEFFREASAKVPPENPQMLETIRAHSKDCGAF